MLLVAVVYNFDRDDSITRDLSGAIAVGRLERGMRLRDPGPVNMGDVEKAILARCKHAGRHSHPRRDGSRLE